MEEFLGTVVIMWLLLGFTQMFRISFSVAYLIVFLFLFWLWLILNFQEMVSVSLVVECQVIPLSLRVGPPLWV